MLNPECNHPCCGDTCRKKKEPAPRKPLPKQRKPLPRPAKPLKKVSKKMAKDKRGYDKAARDFRNNNPYCAIKAEGCTGLTQGVHHVRGRIGEMLMDQNNWLPACNNCNLQVEIKDKWARDNGFKKSKFNYEYRK